MHSFSKPIHGARGLFAMLVVIYHVYNSGLPHVPMPWILHQGFSSMQFGVELFFAISGFVIIGTMRRAATPAQFIVERATRIYPVLWASLPIACAFLILGGRDPFAGYGLLESIGLLIGNFLALGPVLPVPVIYKIAWTLSFEFAFYFMGFIVLLSRRHNRDLTWLMIALGLVMCIFTPRAIFFLAGVLVGTGYAERSPVRYLSRAPGLCILAFLALWQATANPQTPFIDPIYQWGRDFHWLTGPLAFIACTAAINGLVHQRGFVSQILQIRPLLWLGTISFSLYLWHPLVLGTVKDTMRKLALPDMLGVWTQPVFLLIVLPPCLILAAASARLLEGKVTRYLRRRWIGPAHPAKHEQALPL